MEGLVFFSIDTVFDAVVGVIDACSALLRLASVRAARATTVLVVVMNSVSVSVSTSCVVMKD